LRGVFGTYKIDIDKVTEAIAAVVTGKDADRFNFKVPTLCNGALTCPYFHDGEAATLSQAVDVMGRLQLGRKFTTE
jgi:cytochrome c peroxidase